MSVDININCLIIKNRNKLLANIIFDILLYNLNNSSQKLFRKKFNKIL